MLLPIVFFLGALTSTHPHLNIQCFLFNKNFSFEFSLDGLICPKHSKNIFKFSLNNILLPLLQILNYKHECVYAHVYGYNVGTRVQRCGGQLWAGLIFNLN